MSTPITTPPARSLVSGEFLRRWGPLAASVLIVVAGVLRFVGHVTEASYIETAVAFLGFQPAISPTEVGTILVLGVGAGIKLWRLFITAKTPPPLPLIPKP